ncbi:MAG: hypothetical protein LUF04_06985 [Bacteroides sp.]|nr:hypothetical protein [Bacteroides sp.]
MNTTVSQLCELLRTYTDVPVFDYTMPQAFAGIGWMVRETLYDEATDEGEYEIRIYAPNKPREVEGLTDSSYPDIETLEREADQAAEACRHLWHIGTNGWIHRRQLLQEGTMHYINICLTIQFN